MSVELIPETRLRFCAIAIGPAKLVVIAVVLMIIAASLAAYVTADIAMRDSNYDLEVATHIDNELAIFPPAIHGVSPKNGKVCNPNIT